MNSIYSDKVRLLLRVLPTIMEEDCFAIHGGTAINLFVTNLPRLSIDIDLTYIPLEDRETSITHITDTLNRIAERITRQLHGVQVIKRLDTSKLICEYHANQVKIEVNQTKRGVVGGEPIVLPLCQKAQEMFQMEGEARIVPLTLLYGGKIAAALSRQHPRDLFDIRYMPIPLTEAKYGLIFCLLGSDRPIYESLAPNLINQKEAMENQFAGMSDIPFSYEELEDTRNKLITNVRELLTEEDCRFLISFELGATDWEHSSYRDFQQYPSVRWKLQNLHKLQQSNPQKLRHQAERLKELLHISE